MQYEYPGLIPQRVRSFTSADRWAIFRLKDVERRPWAAGPIGSDVVIIVAKHANMTHLRWRTFESWTQAITYVCTAIAYMAKQERAGQR
jgi:hypothetical protein